MTMHTQHSPLSRIGRPLLGAGTLVFALLLAGCGGGKGGSGANAPAASATCANPDTHCAPKP
ncbi:hypothetical protein [Acidovorax sp. SUPP3334]|uniref:hypothetical protein n=1 Tax=Acidovorax sp. SUPP3334 TaxID=2920881 RepID=UPI0023DE2CC3|nr:hypothetical protein [Acidovorax sp. SUPP3334]GKT25564.1 hypothetical protein AVHM3334_18330 [Acidovorax sp. SUPP3334]